MVAASAARQIALLVAARILSDGRCWSLRAFCRTGLRLTLNSDSNALRRAFRCGNGKTRPPLPPRVK